MEVIEKAGTPIGSYAPDFEVPGVDGEVHHLARYLEKYQVIGVVFMSNQCPDVQQYLNRLKQIQADFGENRVTLIGINANDASQDPEESWDKMKVFAVEKQLNFPYVRDVTQDVALCFGAQKTPEAFLLDNTGVLCYRGKIDDNPGDAVAVKEPYLRQAIAQMLEGTTVTLTSTEAIGCEIKWRQ